MGELVKKVIPILALLFLIVAFLLPQSTSGAIKVLLMWQKGSASLAPGRYGHSLVADQNLLYIVGGKTINQNNIPPTDVILCGKISYNGDVTQWFEAKIKLEEAINDAAILMVQRYIYVIGGTDDSGSPTKFVQIASTDLCTQNLQWQVETSLPGKLEKLAATYYDGTIYVVGGRDETKTVRTETYAATILGPGQLSIWNNKLPSLKNHPLYNHSLFAANGYLYAVGGTSTGGVRQRSIYRAGIITPGMITEWMPLPEMYWLPSPLSTLRTVVAGDRVYVIGGYDGRSKNEVWSAELYPDGSISSWIAEEKLPDGFHWHGATIAQNGSIYVAGGITDVNLQSSVYYLPPLSLTKSADPPGPVHEGDVITYIIAYANTGLTTQTITITDQIPFNVSLEPGSISSPGYRQGSQIIWPIGETMPGHSAQVSFRVRVPLLPSLNQLSASTMSLQSSSSASYVLPVPVSCNTTHFWANGVTIQPPPPGAYTFNIQLPPGSNPSEMWLLMKGINHSPPLVEGQPAQQIMTSTKSFSASLWSAAITPEMITANQVTIVTPNPRELNAVFLFDQNDPPFDKTKLEDFYNTTRTFTYTLDLPSVITKTMDVIIPVMDITYLTDSTPPQVDTRLTTVTVEFDDQRHTVRANDPNMGNGLLMTQFPFDIGPLPESLVATKTLTVTVDTEDSVYTLGPRICRPVYIENTAWLCSDKAGCISATATNIPEDLIFPNAVYLPIILKSVP